MRSPKITIDNCKELAHSRKGKCLSKAITTDRKLKWKCEKGHVWQSRIDHIKRGSWCPKCAKELSGIKRRLSINEMRQLAVNRGGSCLSSNYVNTLTHLQWICSKGHQWKTSPASIISGTWCPVCSGTKKKTLEEIKAYCKTKDGWCLSKSYSDVKSKLLFKCKLGHRWNAVVESVLRGGWCPVCADVIRAKKKALNITEPILLAQQRNGKLLSAEYKNTSTPLLWLCEKGHKWKARFYNVKTGTWCPYCAGKIITRKDVCKTVKERGGTLLSDEYNSAKVKLRLTCSNGHPFRMTWDVIKRGGWCPQCSSSIGERICREYFQQIFDCEFPKSHPEWLISEDGFKMELDGYSSLKKIAFEHHGRQHYTFNSRFYFDKKKSEFNRRVRMDARKKKICTSRGVRLIQIPEIPHLLALSEVYSFLKKELEKSGINIQKDEGSLCLNWKAIYSSYQTERFQQIQRIAKSKKGICLSSGYLNNTSKMRFKCKDGHEWEAVPVAIFRGGWCRTCFYNKRRKISSI